MSDQLLEKFNQNRYEGKKSGDQEIDWLFDITESEAPTVEVELAWQNISDKLSKSSTPRHKKSFPVWRVAASLALIAVCIFIFKSYESNQPEMIVKRSEDGRSEVRFPDGSVAILNMDSQVSFAEQFGDTREVQFSGEAYFDIQKSSKPFVIKMGDVSVRVLGTAFNLSTNANNIHVLVDHGLVALEKGNNQIKVAKGELGTLNLKTFEASVDTTPPANIMSWRNGKFLFSEITLQAATEQLSEYYNVTFKLSPNNKNCKITANFNNAPLEEVLSVIEDILNVRIEKADSNIKMKGKGCQ